MQPRKRRSWAPQSGTWPTASEAEIEAVIVRLSAGSEYWPPFKAFEADGCLALATYLATSGRREVIAERLNLTVRKAGRIASPEAVEARLAADLAPFLAGRTRWPRYDEFFNAEGEEERENYKLYSRIRVRGGRYWAEYFGLEFGRGRQSTAKWQDADIIAAMRDWWPEGQDFPTRKQFEAAGKGPLMVAMRFNGGMQFWADKLNIRRVTPSAGVTKTHWNEERILSELQAFCAGATSFPRHADFKAANKFALQAAMLRAGGRPYWAERVGLPLTGSRLRKPYGPRRRPDPTT
jgi:hypothetical protein